MFPIPTKAPEYDKKEITDIINNLDTCPLKNSGVRVVHPVGDGSSRVLLIGEAPGAKEDELGEPFVGRSGTFLNNELLPSVGLNRQNIYLTNIVKCRPPNNRDPLDEEKEAWSGVLISEIAFIKPKVIVCLGRHSMNFFMPEAKISQVHGKLFKLKVFQDLETLILPLYHPAVALYNPGKRPELISDFSVVKKILNPNVKINLKK
jgi:uracil-DNA glycosylase family 4